MAAFGGESERRLDAVRDDELMAATVGNILRLVVVRDDQGGPPVMAGRTIRPHHGSESSYVVRPQALASVRAMCAAVGAGTWSK
jgi:hypothetical protein